MNQEKPSSVLHGISIWLYGGTILLSGETILRYGAFGGAVLSGGFWLACLLMLLLLWKKENFSIHPERSRLGERLLAFSFRMEMITFEVALAGLLLHLLLNLSMLQSCLLAGAASIAFLLLGYRVPLDPRWSSLVRLSLCLFLAVFLPNYVYVQKGLETVYHNLMHYHPRVLHVDQPGLFSFFLASAMILFAHMAAQLAAGSFGDSDSRSFLRNLCLAAVIWSAAVMAFSSMTIVAITQKIEPSFLNELAILLLKQISSAPLFILFAALLLAIVMCSLSLPFRDLSELFLLILGASAGIAAIYCFQWSLLDVFILFGICQGPLGVWKMAEILLPGEAGWPLWIPFSGILASILIYLSAPTTMDHMVIWSTGVTAVFFLVILATKSRKQVKRV